MGFFQGIVFAIPCFFMLRFMCHMIFEQLLQYAQQL